MNVSPYCLFSIYPTADRLDRVVAGAIFNVDGRWDVRVASDASKMLAIDPTFKPQQLNRLKDFLESECKVQTTFEGLISSLQSIRSTVELSTPPQAFNYRSPEHYEAQVSAILRESVEVFKPKMTRRPRNRVRRNLRNRFQAANLWSKNDKDIASHKVVEGFLLSATHDISAEFALKNGVMHITETVDFELYTLSSKRVEAQAKTLVLDEAERVFGAGTQRYVVVAGSQKPEIQPSLRLLQDRARIFALESDNDMAAYMGIMLQAAGSRPLLSGIPPLLRLN